MFASTISQTLQGLNEGTETLQNPFSEADIMNMLSGVGAAGGGGNDQNSFLPFMQGMMQSLLSKEVLYPSLKDILEKYPAWIEDNKDKVSAEELERYKKQQQLMEQVCGQLEKETESDTPEQKKEQFEKVLALMQKVGFTMLIMQNYLFAILSRSIDKSILCMHVSHYHFNTSPDTGLILLSLSVYSLSLFPFCCISCNIHL